MDTAILKILRAIATEKDPTKKQGLKDLHEDELARHFSSASNREDLNELAYDITTQSYSDVMGSDADIIRKIIQVKTVGLTETDYTDEDLRGMMAYWQGIGGQILSGQIREERHFMPRDAMVSAIDLHEKDLETNFWGTFESLKAQCKEKIAQLPVLRLLELIEAAINEDSNPAYYGEFSAADLTDTQVDSVLDPVADRSKGAVTLLGSRQSLRKLANVGVDWGDEIKKQIFTTGIIGVYKGYPLAQIGNFEDFKGSLVIPTDEIWMVGQNAGRLTYYGQQPRVGVHSLLSFKLRWETEQEAGMLLYGASKGRIGRLKLT
jgi:hypothetical protein